MFEHEEDQYISHRLPASRGFENEHSHQSKSDGSRKRETTHGWNWPLNKLWTGWASGGSRCASCTTNEAEKKEIVDDMERMKAENARLRWELREREDLCKALATNHERLQLEKEDLLAELEQLSQSLFEEANRMVAEERMRSNKLEQKNAELSRTLDRTLTVINSTASSAQQKRNSISSSSTQPWATTLKGSLRGHSALQKELSSSSTLNLNTNPSRTPLPLEGIRQMSSEI
ncbi:hypothetical protein SpCBS45565_g03246 [Spizellomyces sp. 'palustris']|nr:hypothetical protein SpCBS45565_g03246 [Spizellomyces sp. 'palustris']